MTSFHLPVSPSHVFVVAGILLAVLLPKVAADTRTLAVAGIVVVYVIGEAIVSSITHRKVMLPVVEDTTELALLKSQLAKLEGKK